VSRRSVEAFVLVTSCLVVTGCAEVVDRSVAPSPGSAETELALERGDFRSVAWIDDARVVIGFEPDPDHPAGGFWVFDPHRPRPEQLELGTPQGCDQVRYQSPHRLPSGRLGLARVCDPVQGEPPDYSKFSVDLIAFDLTTRATTQLLTMTSNPGVITWMADEREAVAGVGSYICQGIVSVRPGGEVPFQVEIADGPTTFRLDDELTRGPRDCDFTGRADFPAYAHRSDRLAFLASPASVGVEGQERLNRSWNVYVLAADGEPHLAVRGVTDPRGIEWSLDDRWLIFSGTVESRGQGTWATAVDSGTTRQVTPRVFDSFDLSPDGTRLIGTDSAGSQPDRPRAAVIVVGLDLP
jgi:hypothetical protein